MPVDAVQLAHQGDAELHHDANVGVLALQVLRDRALHVGRGHPPSPHLESTGPASTAHQHGHGAHREGSSRGPRTCPPPGEGPSAPKHPPQAEPGAPLPLPLTGQGRGLTVGFPLMWVWDMRPPESLSTWLSCPEGTLSPAAAMYVLPMVLIDLTEVPFFLYHSLGEKKKVYACCFYFFLLLLNLF